jgi:hypothetical protein
MDNRHDHLDRDTNSAGMDVLPQARGVKRPSQGLRARDRNLPTGEGAECADRFRHIREMGLIERIVKHWVRPNEV